MANSTSWQTRWAAACWIKVNEHRLRRRASRSPRAFRRNVRLSAGAAVCRFGDVIQSWQEADFAALDPAWRRLAGVTGEQAAESRSQAPPGNADHPRSQALPENGGRDALHRVGSRDAERRTRAFPGGAWERVQRAWIERPRGHSKTSDMAVEIAWILLFARRPVRGLAAAADREQAELIWNAVVELARLNPLVCRELAFRRHAVVNRRTGSSLSIISSDVSSSWGVLPDFVICDELCHWERPDLWYSLFSSAAKRPGCVLAVLTNAGIGRGWHWDAREAARSSPAWHFSSLAGPRAPWIAPEALDEQRRLLPPPVYARLWENRWQHSDGEFVTLAEAEACRDPALAYQTHGRPGRSYIAAIDYAEKQDLTVGVVVHVEEGGVPASDPDARSVRVASPRIVIDRMDVIEPRPDRPVPVAWVEAWMHEIARSFHRVTFVVDEYQLLGTIQRLETLYDVRRFEFRAGRGNHALALNLRKLIVGRGVAWYAGCGRRGGEGQASAGRDDLETELAALVFRQTPGGLCRFDHRRDGRHHDDRSFALAAACLHAVQQPAAGEWLEVSGYIG